MGPVMLSVIKLRLREKLLLHSGLNFITEYEKKVEAAYTSGKDDTSGSGNDSASTHQVRFQLDMKAKERVQADRQHQVHQEYIQRIKELASKPTHLVSLEIDLKNSLYFNESSPKGNLTLLEGESVKDCVIRFCQKHGIASNNYVTLENALKAKVVNPSPLLLLLGTSVCECECE